MPRTVRTKVYKFTELSAKAKEKALDNWAIDTEYFGADEVLETLKQFVDHLGGRVDDYEIDWNNERGNLVSICFDQEDKEDEPVTAQEIQAIGDFDATTFIGFGSCVFTGVCYDENAADGARALWMSGEYNRRKIIEAGIKSLLIAAVNDYEYQQGMEFFADHAEANNYEFTQDGKRF